MVLAQLKGMSAMRKGASATSQQSVQKAIKRLTGFLKTVEDVPVEELEKTAIAIKAKAVAQAPYKTGKLERSIYVRVLKDKQRPGLRAGASARSNKGYNYAGIQHENTDFEHPIKGKAHFISDPFNQEVTNMQRRIRRRLKPK